MSTTLTGKRPLAEAKADAETFRALFDGPPCCYVRWEIAGSVRRGKPQVSDVEHVVIPEFVAIVTGLFDGTSDSTDQKNLLWCRLFELMQDRQLCKHIYGATGPRWGEKYRGVDFRNFNHEIFTADADNFGSILAIRTGPPEFSKMLVTSLRNQSRRQIDGYVWNCRHCEHPSREMANCPDCDDTGLVPVDRLSAPDEQTYFRLCGMAWVDPERRL